jgi:hypothetical protein
LLVAAFHRRPTTNLAGLPAYIYALLRQLSCGACLQQKLLQQSLA